MKKNKQKATINKKVFIIITFILILFLILFFIFNKSGKNKGENLYDKTSNAELSPKFKTHLSDDLKISFQHPSDWYITDKYFNILLTNYKHNINNNYRPKNNEIEIQINKMNECQITLDEQIQIGNCFAEGDWLPTKILNKQIKELPSGTLYIYTILPPSETQRNRYILQNGDRLLEISKQPHPSVFEKEFEEIINSIEFL